MSMEVAQRAQGGSKRTQLQIVGSNAECAVGILGSYVFLNWKLAVTADGSGWTRRAFLEVRRQLPKEKLAFFTVLDAGCTINTPAPVRIELANLLKTYENDLAGAAITFEGKGFKMTMVRSIITAIYMASRSTFPNSVFSEVDPAAQWMSANAPSLRASQIMDAVDELRRSGPSQS